MIRLVDHMGNDAAVVQAARVSYGAGTKQVSDDRSLIRYLMRHHHTTPFEMVEFKFHVKCPMDIWRQWIRHRTASVNEYSTRYSEAIDEVATTEPDEWRLQSGANKQGSGGPVTEWPSEWGLCHIGNEYVLKQGDKLADVFKEPVTPGEYLTLKEKKLHQHIKAVYQERLLFGVAREQARKDLSLSNMTEAYWKIDLHNLFHFLKLRLHPHAQKEIRDYAKDMLRLIGPIVPVCVEAFNDYILLADSLTLQDQLFVENYAKQFPVTPETVLAWYPNKREGQEAVDKFMDMGLI